MYVYNSQKVAAGNGFKVQSAGVGYISNLQWHGVLWYNPFKLVRKEYDTLVLMLHFAHITTWLLLLTEVYPQKTDYSLRPGYFGETLFEGGTES